MCVNSLLWDYNLHAFPKVRFRVFLFPARWILYEAVQNLIWQKKTFRIFCSCTTIKAEVSTVAGGVPVSCTDVDLRFRHRVCWPVGCEQVCRTSCEVSSQFGVLKSIRWVMSCRNLWARRRAQVLVGTAGHAPCHAAPVCWWGCGLHCGCRVEFSSPGMWRVAHEEGGCIADVSGRSRSKFWKA
jgi:hypothetical protein